jgi:poly(3-hydroxybutyrate) depolymerase
MKIQRSCLDALALGALMMSACASQPGGGSSGAAGTNGGGAPGSGAGTTGAAGSSGAGTTGAAGSSGAGTAGSSGAGTAGSSGAGTAGSSGAGTAGSSGVGTAGSTGAGTAGAGGSGAGGPAGSGGGGSSGVPHGMSAGCGNAPPIGDSSSKFTKHDINVTGVDAAFIAAHPANVGGYTYTKRNYFVRLPAGYDSSKGNAVHLGGGGCGNTDGLSGSGGGFTVPGDNQTAAIQIGLSYVYHGDNGACFADGYAKTPDVPFFDAVMTELDASYCFDKGKVFIGGYSSGAWEAYTLGFARGGVLRGIATAAGGLRMDRPTPSNLPFAAILLTGAGDGTNPITGPTGSGLARDLVLKTNGCVGTATTNWPMMGGCVQYTGCPAAFPVIWCTPGGGHTDGGAGYQTAISNFWGALPAVP